MPEKDFPYLTSQEAAEELGVTIWAVQKMAQRGAIKGHYVGPSGARFRPLLIHRDEVAREKQRREAVHAGG